MYSLLVFSLSFSCIAGQLLSNNGKEPLTRREITYTTNIFHSNPYFPDQEAESNIQVELGNYKSKPSSYHKPRSLVTRTHRPYKVEENKPPPRAKPVKYYDQHYQGSTQHSTKIIPKHPGSQLFNVGYSMSFSKGPKKSKPVKDEDPEIIRGTNTGLVQKPDSQEYVANSISDNKRSRQKGKPKQNKYRSPYADTEDPEVLLLSSKTRQSYAGLARPQPISGFKYDEPSLKKERNGARLPLKVSLDTNPKYSHSGEQQNIHEEMVQFLNSRPSANTGDQSVKSSSFGDDTYSQTGTSNSYSPKLQGQNNHKGYEESDEGNYQEHRSVVRTNQRNKVQFSQKPQNQQQQKINWKTIGPNVEIYHSPELPPENFKFDPSEHLEQSKKFDHARALGRSQGFDYSNAVGVQNFQIAKQNVTETSAEDSSSVEDFSSQQLAQPTSTFTQTQNPNPNSFNLHTFNYDVNQSPQILGASAAALTSSAPLTPNFNVIPIDASLIPTHFDTTLLQLAPQNDQQSLFQSGGNYIPQFTDFSQQGLNNLQFGTGISSFSNNLPLTQNMPFVIKPSENPSEYLNYMQKQAQQTDGFAEQSSKQNHHQKYVKHTDPSESANQKANAVSRSPVTFKSDQNDNNGESSVRKPVAVRYEYHPRKGGNSWPSRSNEKNRRYSVRV
ncbi:uncharacterized protein LOC108737354 [Agrilus planipennis]|uniref:Uncharacterized protein LOC108737354 n=1 Tax=Agrilus planipennis TaxID=224129 RepID=A0A1W4WP23_AGRPL|nr:uncharacterized protein LOC108737354 [Agrilus planipennis]